MPSSHHTGNAFIRRAQNRSMARGECAAYRRHLCETHELLKHDIETRLSSFRRAWDAGDEEALGKELLFCILTPQSTAHGCWDTICELSSSGKLLTGAPEDLAPHLHRARFKNKKAVFLVEARERFLPGGIKAALSPFACQQEARAWLADTVKGMGFKEASHFLRNIGCGSDLAILDRHILRSLVRAGTLPEEPVSLSPRRYLAIEDSMRLLADDLSIPLDHLDFVIWYDAKHEIFK